MQIKSVTITKLLQVGKTEQVDLDTDGVNELSITLDSVNLTTSKVTLTITPLVGAAPAAPSENVTQPPAETPAQPPAAAPPTTAPAAKEKVGIGNLWLWIGILSVVVVAIVIVVLVQKLKKD